MVAAGMWSDRRGPVTPLVASMVLFSLGLVVCGAAGSMEVLVAGRLLQGLGGGALTVGLYVVVGLVFPAVLQPAVFASFAAAWVLPALFGPALAALVADTVGWRWVFLGMVALVAAAALLIAPALRGLERRAGGEPAPRSRLAWATVGAVAVLALELLGSSTGRAGLLALAALAVVVVALRHLLPAGTLVARRGLPAVIGTRGLMSAGFFCAEAYIVFVLQEQSGSARAGRPGAHRRRRRRGRGQPGPGEARRAGVPRARDGVGQRCWCWPACVALGFVVADAHPVLAGAAYVLAGLAWASATRAPAWRCSTPRPTATAASTPRPSRSPTRSVRPSPSRSPAWCSPRRSARTPTRSSPSSRWRS